MPELDKFSSIDDPRHREEKTVKTVTHDQAGTVLRLGEARVVGPTEDLVANWLLEILSPQTNHYCKAPGPKSWGVLAHLHEHGPESRIGLMGLCRASYQDLDDLVKDGLIEPFTKRGSLSRTSSAYRELWFQLSKKGGW